MEQRVVGVLVRRALALRLILREELDVAARTERAACAGHDGNFVLEVEIHLYGLLSRPSNGAAE